MQAYLRCLVCDAWYPVDEELASDFSNGAPRLVSEDDLAYVERSVSSEQGVWCNQCNTRVFIVQRDMLQECAALLSKYKAYLYQGEMQDLRSLISKLETGGGLQTHEIKYVEALGPLVRLRAERHAQPQFYRGGNPGSGKRSG